MIHHPLFELSADMLSHVLCPLRSYQHLDPSGFALRGSASKLATLAGSPQICAHLLRLKTYFLCFDAFRNSFSATVASDQVFERLSFGWGFPLLYFRSEGRALWEYSFKKWALIIHLFTRLINCPMARFRKGSIRIQLKIVCRRREWLKRGCNGVWERGNGLWSTGLIRFNFFKSIG